jgi:hypothetical protein
MKICSAEAELFYVNEQIDATNLVVVFTGGLYNLWADCLRLINACYHFRVCLLLLEMAVQSHTTRSHVWKIRGYGVGGLLTYEF